MLWDGLIRVYYNDNTGFILMVDQPLQALSSCCIHGVYLKQGRQLDLDTVTLTERSWSCVVRQTDMEQASTFPKIAHSLLTTVHNAEAWGGTVWQLLGSV